jgi:hypothetical protein
VLYISVQGISGIALHACAPSEKENYNAALMFIKTAFFNSYRSLNKEAIANLLQNSSSFIGYNYYRDILQFPGTQQLFDP